MASLALPFDEFPDAIRRAILGLRHARRGRRAYSEASVKAVIHATGQYLRVVHEADLPAELSCEGFSRFIEYMDGRSLKASSRLTYLASLQAVAKATSYPRTQRRLILEDIACYRDEACLETPRKVRKLAEKPLTLLDVGAAAFRWAEEARMTANLNRRRSFLHRSTLCALLSLVPMRISDATALCLGRQVTRLDGRWSLHLTSGKTSYETGVELHHHLWPYLDALLDPRPGEDLQAAYARQIGRPLFARHDGKHLTTRALAASFEKATGHTPHIVRTLAHDAIAEAGRDAGMARVLCGQATPAMSKVYEVHAPRHRVSQGQETLKGLQEKLLVGKSRATGERDGPSMSC